MRGRTGRRVTYAAVRTLVRPMAAANPLWGAPRIRGESNSRHRDLGAHRFRCCSEPSQTSRTFVTNHVATLVLSIAVFTAPALREQQHCGTVSGRQDARVF